MNEIQNQGKTLAQRVTDVLKDIGVPQHVLGYHYLRMGVIIAYKDYKSATSITKFLYPEVAKQFGTTGTRVERAMRHAIELTMKNPASVKAVLEHLGNSLDTNMKVTTGQFVLALADELLLEDQDIPIYSGKLSNNSKKGSDPDVEAAKHETFKYEISHRRYRNPGVD